MRNEVLDKNKLNRLVDAMLVEMKGEHMTGFKSKQAVAQAKLNDDDDIQDYKREWVGLTDEEIAQALGLKTHLMAVIRDARAIEQALKEKNT